MDTKPPTTSMTPGAMMTLQREAKFLRELLLSCGAVPRESVVMQAALDAVTVVLQRAELGILRNKIKQGNLLSDLVSEESHAATAIVRGVDEELATLDSILTSVYVAAKGKRTAGLHGNNGRSTGANPSAATSISQATVGAMSASESEVQQDDPVSECPTPAPEENPAAIASVSTPHSALKAEPSENFVLQPEDNTGPTIVTSPIPGDKPDMPPPPLWFIEGRHRRVPPGWNFPKCNSRDLWLRYWLPCNNGPAIKHLDAVDVSHLKRGGRTLADIKSLVTVIKNEAIRRGMWSEDPRSEEEAQKLFEDCREYLEGLTEPVTDGDETTTKRKRKSQYSWQTDIKRARESIKKARSLGTTFEEEE